MKTLNHDPPCQVNSKARSKFLASGMGLLLALSLPGCGGGVTDDIEALTPLAADAPHVFYDAPIDEIADPDVATALAALRSALPAWDGADGLLQVDSDEE